MRNDGIQQTIRRELSRRSAKNPRYSLRSLARAAGIDPGNLSRVMSGKAGLSEANARKLSEVLGLSDKDSQAFVQAADLRSKRREPPKAQKPETLDVEVFAAIQDLYHAAILEMTFLPSFRADAKWIAATLGIAPLDAKLALERLKALKLIVERDGQWVKSTTAILRTPPGKTTSATLRNHQIQVLQKGIECVHSVPIDQRVNASMTFPMATSRLEAARTLIERFALHLCKAMSREERDNVFQLGICLYPLTKSKGESK